MSNPVETITTKSTKDYLNKTANVELIKDELSLIRKNFDRYHNKSIVVNGARTFFTDLATRYKCSDSQLKSIRNANQVVEQYHIKYNGFDIALTIKTYMAVSVVSSDIALGTTIQKMNETIEKSKKYFGQDLMIFIRDYFCLKLITSAIDHRLDAYCEDGEFSFRFSVPSARLNIELLILN